MHGVASWKQNATALALAYAHVQTLLEHILQKSRSSWKFYLYDLTDWIPFIFPVTACDTTTESKLSLFHIKSLLYSSLYTHTAFLHIRETFKLFSHRGFHIWILMFQKSWISSCFGSIHQTSFASFSSTVHIRLTHSSILTAHHSYALPILATSKSFDSREHPPIPSLQVCGSLLQSSLYPFLPLNTHSVDLSFT